MSSVFKLINNYQDSIIASITIALGAVQGGVSSWGIHRVIHDEHFLIYILGLVMHQKTKDIKEVIANYSNLKEFLHHDLFEILTLVKIGFSIALVAGIGQVLISILLLALVKRESVRKLWMGTTVLGCIGLGTAFGLVLKSMMPNVVYFQVFLAVTGVNFFLMFHLIVTMGVEMFKKGPEDKTTTNVLPDIEASGSSTESWTTAVTSVSLNNQSSSTSPSTSREVVDAGVQTAELPLPPPPPANP